MLCTTSAHRYYNVQANWPAIQLEATIVDGDETSGVVSSHQTLSCTKPELEDGDHTKRQRHPGHDKDEYTLKKGVNLYP